VDDLCLFAIGAEPHCMDETIQCQNRAEIEETILASNGIAGFQ
jgi:hypothetical protein